MTNYDVVKKLIGAIDPIGETNTDKVRLENLKEMTILVDFLLADIYYLQRYEDSPQYSLKQAGEFASKFIRNLDME